jgi:purine-binding chemotaxis protein CheW
MVTKMMNQNTKEKSEISEKMLVASFFCHNKLFGIPIEDVLEVNKNINITHIPLAPSYVEGVINLRGQIITALNLQKRLGIVINKEDIGKKHHNVVIGTRNNAICLLVDEIGDVLEISSDMIEPPPETIKGLDLKYVRNVCKLKGELLVVLDTEKIQIEE